MITNKNTPYDYEVAIIGAGFAGIGAGLRLKMQGESDFIIFERAASVGGTWRDNTYPGCACDIPSFLYSYSFIPNPNWTRSFSKQEEIYNYLKACVKDNGLEDHISYNTDIDSLIFDKNRGLWTVSAKNGKQVTVRMVISSAGPFNAPFIPNIKGKDTFKGETFHSLTWNHDYDLKGKKVAVIGTGASAIQFVPEIAPLVKELNLFQRTAPWITPKLDKELTEKAQKRFTRFPWYQRMWREIIYWVLEHKGKAFFGDKKIRAARKKEALDHLHNSIADPALRKKLRPDYEVGCKRILISDNYYPTLTRDNVNLISGGVEEICENGVMFNGELIEVDAIIYGTGFYTTEFPDIFKIIGLNNRDLFQEFNTNGPEAYYGMTVHGFPNFAFMVGPNSGLGHNSIIHMMESELNYILDYLKKLRQTDQPTAYFDLKKEVQKAFNEDIQAQLSKMVWSDGGCKSYYLINKSGKNSSLWPGSTMSYRKQTKKVKLEDYTVVEPVLEPQIV